MVLLKILLFFMVLSGYIRKSIGLDDVEDKKLSIYTNKKEANGVRECFCFPKTSSRGKRVSEVISPNNELQERLVLFLFKTKNNNFTIYIPNKEKQRIFPDMTLDEGDKLGSLNTEKLVDLYYINSQVAINNVEDVNWQKNLPTHNSMDTWPVLSAANNFGTIKFDIKDLTSQAKIMHTKPDNKLHLHFEKKHPSVNDLLFPGNLTVFPLAPEHITLSETENAFPSSSDLAISGDLNLLPSPLSEKYPSISELLLPGDLTVLPLAPEHISLSVTGKTFPSSSDLSLSGDDNMLPSSSQPLSSSETSNKYSSISSWSLPEDLTMFTTTSKPYLNVVSTSDKYPSNSELLLPGDLTMFPLAPEHFTLPGAVKTFPSHLSSSGDLNILPSSSQPLSSSETKNNYASINDFLLSEDLTVFTSTSKPYVNLVGTSEKYPILSELLLPGNQNVFPLAPEHNSLSGTEKAFPSNSDLSISEDLNVLPSLSEQISWSETSKKRPSIHEQPLPGNVNIFPSTSEHISLSDTSYKYPSSDLLLAGDLSAFPPAPEPISLSEISNKFPSNSELLLSSDQSLLPLAAEQISSLETSKKHPSINELHVPGGVNVFPSTPEHITLSETSKNEPSSSYLSLFGDLNILSSPSKSQSLSETSNKYPGISDLLLTKDLKVFPSDEHHDESNGMLIAHPPGENIDGIKLLTPKFEQWFQGENFFIGNNKFLQLIDQGKFKLLLLKVFQKNGVTLSKSGELIDWNGNTLNMKKLKLIPIFMGDHVDNNKLINQNKCLLPNDLSYLEAVLVSLTYPPRILGVLPLGKILKSDTNKKETSSNGPCQIKNNNNKHMKLQISDNIDLLTNNLIGLPEYKKIKEYKKIFTNLMKPSGTSKGLIENMQPLKDRKTKMKKVFNDYKIFDTEDDLLGLRIIGGKAATGSGTPVTSRGRSGAK